MSGLDKNRKRNQTVCFRMTPEEVAQLNARVKISGLPKGTYIIESVLNQQIRINVGKYQSDRLAFELKRLCHQMEQLSESEYAVQECKVLLKELLKLCKANDKE